MLNFASPGQLPEQPPGPFLPTGVASFDGLVDAAGEIFMGCVQKRGVGLLPDLRFGWVRAGESSLWNVVKRFGPDLMLSLTDARGIGIGGNIAVLFTGTKSQIDRSIPRGIHP